MNLDEQLKSARLPERSAGYWERFPKRVVSQLGGPRSVVAAAPRHLWQWAAGCATASLALALVFWFAARRPLPTDYAKLYREIAAMFPNQIRAIIVDGTGIKLVLSEIADVPDSPPLLVRACARDGCRNFITFSGQQVKVNGDTWDVLVNGQNEVVVAGQSTDRYRIEARRLEGKS